MSVGSEATLSGAALSMITVSLLIKKLLICLCGWADYIVNTGQNLDFDIRILV